MAVGPTVGSVEKSAEVCDFSELGKRRISDYNKALCCFTACCFLRQCGAARPQLVIVARNHTLACDGTSSLAEESKPSKRLKLFWTAPMPLSKKELKRRIVELQPWHHDVEVVPGLSTGVARDIIEPEEPS